MDFNFLAIVVAALVPLALGFVWYNPKVFGKIWQKEANLSDYKLQNGNLFKIFGISFIMSLMMAFMMNFLVIHQLSIIGLIGGDINNATPTYTAFAEEYKDAFRTFPHGFTHGMGLGIFILLPMIVTNGLFERKSWKLMLINAGYWVLCAAIIGGIICGWR